MFWIFSAVVLAAVLLGAWLYDRRHGTDRVHGLDDVTRAQAEADASATQHRSGGGVSGF